ncbi:MAG TPA: hypothetical protein VF065_16415, partial [Ilumatobacter sp.]
LALMAVFGSALVVGLVPTAALANHVPSATYTGTTAGGAAVAFNVSPDGASVLGFAWTNVETPCGTVIGSQSSMAIGADHTFANTATYGMRISGSFPAVGTASGTLRFRLAPPLSCDSGDIAWMASTSARPTPAPTPAPTPIPPPTPSVDTTAPQTTITKHPQKTVLTTALRVRARFAFRSSEPGSRFECKLDRGAWRACASSKTFRVKRGKHVLKVRAIDASGNSDATSAVWRWIVRRG